VLNCCVYRPSYRGWFASSVWVACLPATDQSWKCQQADFIICFGWTCSLLQLGTWPRAQGKVELMNKEPNLVAHFLAECLHLCWQNGDEPVLVGIHSAAVQLPGSVVLFSWRPGWLITAIVMGRFLTIFHEVICLVDVFICSEAKEPWLPSSLHAWGLFLVLRLVS